MNDTRRIARNSLFQAIGLGLQALTVFLIPLLMARRADPERLGEYITIITLVGLFAFISAYGFPSLLTREIARFRDDKDRIVQLVSTTVGLVVVLSLVAIGLMVVLGLVLGYSSAMLRALLLAGMALGVESMARVTAAAFRGIEAMQWSTAITSIMNLAFLVFAVVAIWFDAPVDWLIAAYLASRIVSLAAARWFFSLHFGPLWPRLDRKEWQALLKTGLPFSVNNVFTFAYGRLNIVILSILSGNAAVGFYEIALALTSRTNILAWTVTFALYPFLSSQHVQDQKTMRAYAAKSVRYLLIPGFLITALLWVFGNDVLGLVYGETYVSGSGQALRLLALIVPLRYIDTSLGTVLSASNRERQRATAVVLAAVVNVVLSLTLISMFDLIGAVYATLITEAFVVVLFVWYLRNEAQQIIEWQAFLGPALGVLAIAIVSFLLDGTSIWLLGILFILIYGLMIFGVDRSSREALRHFTTRTH